MAAGQAIPNGSTVSAIGEHCPLCRARVAPDQRYCLSCGQRRGEPRLPFMDAAGLIELATSRPSHPPAVTADAARRRGLPPGVSLVAGIATLVLAMGVGVLIGNSKSSGTPVASSKPSVQVIRVAGAGAGAGVAESGHVIGANSKLKGGGAGAKASSGAEGSENAANSVLHPTASAGKLPPPTVSVGSTGSGRGYSNHKFTGEFFK